MKEIDVNQIRDIIEELGLEGQFNINDIYGIYDIVQIGDKRLRKENKEIENISDIRNMVIKMVSTLYDEKGCGLAAPQIGENLKLFIVKVISKDENDEEYEELPLTVFINPEIIEYSDEKEKDYEGCLSVQGFFAKVERSKKIKISYLDLNGKKHVREYTNFVARAIQHEYDHLQGIVYTDIADMKTFTTSDNFTTDNTKN